VTTPSSESLARVIAHGLAPTQPWPWWGGPPVDKDDVYRAAAAVLAHLSAEGREVAERVREVCAADCDSCADRCAGSGGDSTVGSFYRDMAKRLRSLDLSALLRAPGVKATALPTDQQYADAAYRLVAEKARVVVRETVCLEGERWVPAVRDLEAAVAILEVTLKTNADRARAPGDSTQGEASGSDADPTCGDQKSTSASPASTPAASALGEPIVYANRLYAGGPCSLDAERTSPFCTPLYMEPGASHEARAFIRSLLLMKPVSPQLSRVALEAVRLTMEKVSSILLASGTGFEIPGSFDPQEPETAEIVRLAVESARKMT
jgi:hypothetical protein